jgi:mono/diheme cytochrome c family protein
MHAGRLQGSRLIPSSWRVAELLVLFIFGVSVLDLPVHLVHHLGEVAPDCQLLGLAVSLNASSLDGNWLPPVDCTWDDLLIPVLIPSVALLWESAQARAPLLLSSHDRFHHAIGVTHNVEDATMSHRWTSVGGGLCIVAFALAWGLHAHPEGEHSRARESVSHDHPNAPIKITTEELHRLGGVPPGWQFRFPDGDRTAGRAVFAKLECYQCHTIQGEPFPQTSMAAGNIGPELTGMGSHHPVEYFAESILNPNAVIITGTGYTDAEGLSIMPDYRDTMTVAEFIDLLAYLQSLKGVDAHDAEARHDGHDDHGALLDQVVGDYRIRVMYHEGKADGHRHESNTQRGHGGGTARAKAQNHLIAFISDGKTREPVPYLPVSVTITTAKQSPRTAQLTPMMGAQGFHYGADVTLPPQAAKVTLSIGPTTMRVMPSATGRFVKPQHVTLDWTPQSPASPGARGHTPQHPNHGKESGAKGP